MWYRNGTNNKEVQISLILRQIIRSHTLYGFLVIYTNNHWIYIIFSEQDTPGKIFKNDDMNKNRFEKTSGTTGGKSKTLRFQDS